MVRFIKLPRLAFASLIFLFIVLLFAITSENNGINTQNKVKQEELITGYSLSVDSKTVFVLENEEETQKILDSLLGKAQRYYGALDNYSTLNEIQISKGEYDKSSFSTVEEAKEAAGVSVTLGSPTIKTSDGDEITISLSYTSLTEEYEKTDFTTKYEYTYGVNKSYEKVVSNGAQGTVRKLYESKMVDGKPVFTSLIYESVVVAPVDRVIEIGVTPIMQLSQEELAFFIKPYDGKVSSDYGYRYLNGYEFHTGIDLVAKNGSCYGKTAVAAADGVVVESGYSSSRGNYVIIKHEYGFSTIYMHFSKRLVSKGDKVSAGDPIGTIGSTGRSTGAHLHFEIRLNGDHTNPENYLSFK
jgi:murein DD-endopeptidase MepM/ murein hydrolase activator NlpD